MPRGGRGPRRARFGCLLLARGLPARSEEPFDVLINKSHALAWGVEWEKVSYAGSEGLRFKRSPTEGALHDFGVAHPDRLPLLRDVAVEVRGVGPGSGSAHTYADMEKMLEGGGVLLLKLLHDAQVPGPVSVALEKPSDRPLGLDWTALPPEATRAGLRITGISRGGLFDRSVGADPDHAGQKLVVVGDTILQVRRTDPGEVRLALSGEEMEHLLGRVGSLEMVIHREVPRNDYHCTPGLNNIPSEWAGLKRAWCCNQFASSGLVQASYGCKYENASSDTNVSSKIPAEDSHSFDCDAGLDKAERGWSEDKKRWCCAHEQKGCEKSANTSDKLATQTGQARVVVSGKYALDDFNDKYQDVVEYTIRTVYGYSKLQLVAASRRLRTVLGQSLSENASGPLHDRDDGGVHVFHYDVKGTCKPGCEINKPPRESSNKEFQHELEQNLDAYNASLKLVDAGICFGDGCQLGPDFPWELAALALAIVALAAVALAAIGAKKKRSPGGKEEQRSPLFVDESDAGAPWLEPPTDTLQESLPLKEPMKGPPTDTLPKKVSMIEWLDGPSAPGHRADGSEELGPQRAPSFLSSKPRCHLGFG